jgi:hypothetical protein
MEDAVGNGGILPAGCVGRYAPGMMVRTNKRSGSKKSRAGTPATGRVQNLLKKSWSSRMKATFISSVTSSSKENSRVKTML